MKITKLLQSNDFESQQLGIGLLESSDIYDNIKNLSTPKNYLTSWYYVITNTIDDNVQKAKQIIDNYKTYNNKHGKTFLSIICFEICTILDLNHIDI